GFDKWLRISDLLAAAQAAGVFGVDGASIGVLHLAGERGFVDAHRFTLTTPGYGGMCSDELDTLDLLTDHLSGADAAVHTPPPPRRPGGRSFPTPPTPRRNPPPPKTPPAPAPTPPQRRRGNPVP